jgi:DNA-binding beta-propeller fold protein YncE
MSRTRKGRRVPFRREARLVIALGCLGFAACDSDGSAPQSPSPPKEPPAEQSSIAINVAANDPAVQSPFDATPSPDGKAVYYTALREEAGERVPGIFKVPASGGEIQVLASGEPLAAPLGITVSLDGETLYLADPGAANGGAIMTLSASGGAVSPLAGTEGYRPGGLVIAKQDEQPALWFTGVDPSTGARGVFMTAPGGGGVTAVATGAPFMEPGGVTVSKEGRVFVADALASDGLSALIEVNGGQATRFVDGIGVGFPAGVTLTHDESTIVVSGLDPASRTDVVYMVNAETGEISRYTDTVGAFHEPAGLHRAHDANVFAWADSRANDTGTVYVLKP